MKGRPPKTKAQHKVDGTYQKVRHANRVKQPPVEGIPPAPEDFTKRHLFWWEHFVKNIKSFAELTEPHLNTITLLCRLMVEREILDADIQKNGHTFETGSGQIKINPAFTARQAIDSNILKIYDQFGFSLRSSMNLKTDKPKQGTSTILEMMNGGKKKKIV